MYALVQNDAVSKYPYTVTDARRDNPDVSFPPNPDDATMAVFGAMRVVFTNAPSFNQDTQRLQEGTPVFNVDRWEQTWQVVDLTAEELQAKKQALQDGIVAQTQQRLDTFAQTRNYDGILSACTYATSPTAKFAAEGQYCVESRDATWAKLYSILAEVEAGTRPMPTGYADIEAELPTLVWPL